MTREEAIKILWIHKSKSIYVNSIAKAIDMAIEALKAQEWIPVSESPKQEKKEYLIQTDTGCICVCRWTNVNHFQTDLTTDWHWHIYDIPRHSKIVAWKESPEPYKAESEKFKE